MSNIDCGEFFSGSLSKSPKVWRTKVSTNAEAQIFQRTEEPMAKKSLNESINEVLIAREAR